VTECLTTLFYNFSDESQRILKIGHHFVKLCTRL